MNSKINEMLLKIDKLERQIKSLGAEAEKVAGNGSVVKIKDFINFAVSFETKLKVATVKVEANANLLFEGVIFVYAPAEQSVEISLFIQDVLIAKTAKELVVGENEIEITQDYKIETKSEIEIYIVIKPLLNKQIILRKCELGIWGCETGGGERKYQVLPAGEKLILSVFENETLYYKIITKQQAALGENDFDLRLRGFGFSFAYKKDENAIILSLIDLNKRLFLNNLKTKTSKFVAENVSDVSCVCLGSEIVGCYVCDGEVFSFKLKDGKVESQQKISYKIKTKKCNLFYNEFAKKLFLILTNFEGKNILLEQVFESQNFGENLSARIGFDFCEYEVQNEY